MTRSKFAPWLRRLHSAQAEVRLSAPAMETLAVVAYRQPVLRAEIEAIRGVQSGEVLRQLIERGLVRIAGRSSELGRPFLYGTTKQFLQVFGLQSLEALPRADVLRTNPSAPTNQEIVADPNTTNSTLLSQVAEEETNVKTVITTKAQRSASADNACPMLTRRNRNDRLTREDILAKHDEDEDEDDLEDEDDEDEDDDLDDEPWEEVDDDDLDDEEDDDDEDEDWDDEDEDWDEDEDEDWDDDEDEDWEEDEEEDDKDEGDK